MAELMQAADVEDQLPAVVALLVVWFRPPWHAGEPDAIPDDVADLSIRQLLSFVQAQVRHLGVKIPADLGLSGAIRPMTNGAASQKAFARLLQHIGRGLPRICFLARLSGDGQVARSASHNRFNPGWLIGCAKAAPNHARCVEAKRNQCGATNPCKKFPQSHIFYLYIFYLCPR